MPIPDTTPQNISSEYGDMADVSSSVRSTWGQVRMEQAKANEYYSGEVFQKRVEIENGDPTEAPLLYPVGLNLVKMLVLSMTDAALGEFEEGDIPVFFRPQPSIPDNDQLKAISAFAAQIYKDSSAATFLWESEFDRNLYGGSVTKISPNFNMKSKIKLTRVPVGNFYPIFDPEDPDVLLEVYVAYYLYKEQARARFGYDGTSDMPLLVEHWTQKSYETILDKKKIDLYSGINPYAIVPFVFTPRQRTLDPFGESLIHDVFSVQDELNARLADAGEALNYNMHPVRTGINLPSTFTQKNYPLAPDAMWDLGRALTNDMLPQVQIHEIKNPVPNGLFEYIKFLYDWGRTSSFAPPIAFGEDSGGGQRSGVTLEIRLWPLLKAMQRSRAYMASGIQRTMKISARILAQKKFPDVDASLISGLADGLVEPRFHRILPRDQVAAVDEVVKLMSTRPQPMISPQEAVSVLGRGPQELAKILTWLDELESKGMWPEKPAPVEVSDTGSEQPGKPKETPKETPKE